MSAFDRIIGYDHIKAELMQISDMIHHPEVYAALDAKLPQGLLLSGTPGLGKTLMATALMEDSGLPCFTVRRSQVEDEFLKQLAHTFDEAAEAAPSMLLLDDMDKFSSDEFSTAAFTAVQSCIDKVQEKQVFVIATANNVEELPDSLLRCGRFDRQIKVQRPNCTDGEQIIRRYLYMLTGDENRVKPDRHIVRFIKETCALQKLTDDDVQAIMVRTVEMLKPEYPNITVRFLDSLIWETQRR